MKKGDNMKKQGFTIIEVALVLGIAGLIFLMMMIALPALQRQQRDTKRKEDIDSLIANIKKYQTNNRGALPTNDWNNFMGNYYKEGFEDPSSGESYNTTIAACGSVPVDASCTSIQSLLNSSFPNDFKMYVVTEAKCSDSEDTGALKTSNPRRVAVLYKLEGGGLYCANS